MREKSEPKIVVLDGVRDGGDYRFECSKEGTRFSVVVDSAALDAFDRHKYPSQPADGRMKRMAMALLTIIVDVIERTRHPIGEDLRLTDRDLYRSD